MSVALQTSASSFPEFACQPTCFNQSFFRDQLKKNPPIQVFKEAISGVNAKLDQRFLEGEDIRNLIYERATFIDLILHYAWHRFEWGDTSLVAVGGYGRGELHPQSDIDLLILLENQAGNSLDATIQNFITFLWDIGLEIGSSVRTVKECVAIAKADITVASNIMEARRIAGSTHLLAELFEKTNPDKIWDAASFYRAKCEEQTARHEKHNNTEYNLEPNIKNAPGGLRDIQTINWLAKRYFQVHTIRQLEGKDFFTEHEFGVLHAGEEFLWRVRYGLHMLTKRPEERLLFEHQRELAKLFGFQDTEERLAVEHFMHKYYRTVMALRELNDVLLQYLGEVIHRNKDTETITQLNDRFQLRDGFIEVTRNSIFTESPSALLEIFVLMGNDREIRGVRAPTIRLIRENRWRIDESFRNTPENKRLFISLFSIKYGLVSQLSRMVRYGILGRYLPAFGKIIGQMQHDLFHRYTVDAHTIHVIKNMRRFTLPESEEKFPIAAHIINNLAKPELLYIAGLFHDIGKGRGGDHSVLGAVDAEEFCRDHGLSGRETRLVVWLVEKHLLMSYVSQKQDVSDPDVIRNFAINVGDQLHLDYLYALTVADMNGTNPEIWNAWRASLLRQLYLETKRALRRGLENTIDLVDIIEEKQVQALFKLEDKKIDKQSAQSIWEGMGNEYFVRETHHDIAWQTEALINHSSESPLVLIRESSNSNYKGTTQIFIYIKNAQHVFTAVATCLAQLGLNIQDARIYTSATGYTLDTFHVLNDDLEPLGDNDITFKKIESAIQSELKLIGHYSEIAKKITPRELKQFAIPTRTEISNDISRNCTVLQVVSPDRPGLLATIAKVFMDFDIVMESAKISTLGERVEDVFFISDATGNPLGDPKLCTELQSAICKKLDEQVELDNTY